MHGNLPVFTHVVGPSGSVAQKRTPSGPGTLSLSMLQASGGHSYCPLLDVEELREDRLDEERDEVDRDEPPVPPSLPLVGGVVPFVPSLLSAFPALPPPGLPAFAPGPLAFAPPFTFGISGGFWAGGFCGGMRLEPFGFLGFFRAGIQQPFLVHIAAASQQMGSSTVSSREEHTPMDL